MGPYSELLARLFLVFLLLVIAAALAVGWYLDRPKGHRRRKHKKRRHRRSRSDSSRAADDQSADEALFEDA